MAGEADLQTIIERLRGALTGYPDIAFAVLFGSAVAGRLREDSDLDVAVYVAANGALEVEADRPFPEEADVQIALERASGRNVDLLLLNRDPATVCSAALLTGRPIVVRDGPLFSRYYLAVTNVAIDFLATEREYRNIASRSESLTEIDRERLDRVLQYVEEELEDRSDFESVDLLRYRDDRGLRRNLDRWVEMLITATIDVAKIVLASEHKAVPRTYGQILEDLETTPPFDGLQGRLKPLAPLRNTMAHEYLDLRFPKVREFVVEGADAVEDLANLAQEWKASQPG